jgi:chlorobactene glucosyltransferase
MAHYIKRPLRLTIFKPALKYGKIGPVSKLIDPVLWFYIVIAMVWLYRARRALESLALIPVVPKQKFGELSSSVRDMVTVIVPARNEEKNIRLCLENLLKQDYPHLQILVVNDRSTDRTEALLQELQIPLVTAPNTIAHPARAAYLNAPEPPPDWTGKNAAIHAAIPWAKGKWLLFTDADTQHEPESISSAMAYMKDRELRFLTLAPRCLAETLAEKIFQPVAMAFLGLWFPLEKANDPQSPTIFGNGQYLLIQQRLYEQIGGHAAVHDAFLEDYGLMRLVKIKKAAYQCAFGYEIFGTRMYTSVNALWAGWRRIYGHAFENRAGVLLFKALNVLFFSVLPFACWLPATQLAMAYPSLFGFGWGVACVTLLFILMTCWKTFCLISSFML